MDGPTAHWSRLLDMSPDWDYCRQTFFRGDWWVLTTWHAADGTGAESTLFDRVVQRQADVLLCVGAGPWPGLLWRREYPSASTLTPGGLDEAHEHLVAQIVAGCLPPSA